MSAPIPDREALVESLEMAVAEIRAGYEQHTTRNIRQGRVSSHFHSAELTLAEQIAALTVPATPVDALKTEAVHDMTARESKDSARMDWLETRGVQSIYFNDQGQMNPGISNLRRSIDFEMERRVQ